MMEIGSEYCIDNTILDENLEFITPYWLKKFGNVVLTSSGRGALSLILDSIEPRTKKALLPSFICDSVIMPFINAGYQILFYDLDKHFSPHDIAIENNSIDIFFHMGYFGFPTNNKAIHAIKELKKKSVIIIEDVTHTLLSPYYCNQVNDFVIGSIRKWFGIASGGFAASKQPLNLHLSEPPKNFIDLRLFSMKLKDKYLKTNKHSLKDKYLKNLKKAEDMINDDSKAYDIDSLSKQLIQTTDVALIKKARKVNYNYLFDSLFYIDGLDIVFNKATNDTCPFFFPVYVKHDRDRLRSELIRKEVYCPIHWPIPKMLNKTPKKLVKEKFNSLLSIPCDQRYGIHDMARVVFEIQNIMEI